MADFKFGLIGTGRFGKHYIRLLHEIPGIELAAIANKSQGNTEAVLTDPEIDCIVICTPASTHFEYIKKALVNGKHVLTEKPMVLSVSEAVKVLEQVKTSDKIFMVAHQNLFNKHVVYLAEQIRQGILGKLLQVTIEHLYPGPIREDVGVFWDAAPHDFAILDFVVGPVLVKTASGEKRYTAGRKVEDYVAANVELANGTKVMMTLSSNAEKKVRRRVFVGDKGSAVFDDSENNDFLEISANGKRIIPQIAVAEPLRTELEHFIDCVRNKKIPLTNVEHGLRVIKNLESTYEKLK